MKIRIQDLSTPAFSPFGQIIARPERENDASGPGWLWWGELVKMEGGDRPYAIGYLDLKPAELRFDWAERHMQSDELIAPLGGDCLVYVAPAEYLDQPERMPEQNQFQVFRVRQGQAVLLNKGVWHGAPMAAGQPVNALVILLQNSSKQDGFVQRFEEAPIEIEVPD